MSTFQRLGLSLCMIVIALAGVGLLTAAPSTAQAASAPVQLADNSYGLDESVASEAGLPNKDLKPTILSIVRWALGFLGLVGVILVVYAGFMWMTAAGNEERISKAKEIMTAALIGLVIIILSYAIVSFFVGGINEATTT